MQISFSPNSQPLPCKCRFLNSLNKMDILEENDNFTLSEEVNGSLLAAAVGIELLLALTTNLFVLIFTLCHPKTLKQPSIIFLTNFVLVNLLMAVLVMPFTITTASFGEWVFGKTLEEKNGTCQFVGFVFAYTIQLTILTLAVMSVDRFLFIVKPLFYKRFMKTWVAIVIVVFVWILSCLLNIPPYFGLGQYAFGQFTATCVQVWVGHKDFLIFFCLIMLVVVTIITVTTLWTFCFTRRFIKRARDQLSTSKKGRSAHDHVYTSRMKKLIGIFGMLLMVTVLTFVPAILASLIGIIIGSNNLPGPVFAIVVISFLVNSIANPVVQSYFRKDVNEFIVHYYNKAMKMFCCMILTHGETSTTSTSGQGSSTHLTNFNQDK